MAWQPGSDIGIQILLVARDGLRLEVAGLRIKAVDPRTLQYLPAPTDPPPYRRVWIQAASPPPTRIDGCPWYQPFAPGHSVPPWLQRPEDGDPHDPRDPYDGLPKLGLPSPGTVVLDQQLMLAFQRGRKIECTQPEPGDPMGFPATGYPQPDRPVDADFYGEYELAWTRSLSPGAWVALSFDRFAPDVLSAPFLLRVSDTWLFESEPDPKAYAAG